MSENESSDSGQGSDAPVRLRLHLTTSAESGRESLDSAEEELPRYRELGAEPLPVPRLPAGPRTTAGDINQTPPEAVAVPQAEPAGLEALRTYNSSRSGSSSSSPEPATVAIPVFYCSSGSDTKQPIAQQIPDFSSDSDQLPDPDPDRGRTKIRRPRRNKVECPECQKFIVNLPRHLRQFHKLQPEKRAKSKAGYVLRYCPFDTCGKPMARLRQHMADQHHIKSKEDLDLLMLRAKVVIKRPMRPICITSSSSEGEVPCPRQLTPSPSPQRTPSPVLFSDSEQGEEDEQEDTEQAEVPPAEESWRFNRLMQQFYAWLTGPDVDKDGRTAHGHATQVWNVWRTLSRTPDPDVLLNVDAIKTDWLSPFLTRHRPGTIKSYLGSLCLFMEFMLSRRLTEHRTEATAAIAEIRRLSKVMRKRSLRRRVEKETEDLGAIITPDQVDALLTSPRIRAIENLLKDPSITFADTAVFLKCRNYIMFRILLANGQRTGVLLGITPAAIEKARVTPDGAVLTIAEHKTGYMYPAQVALPEPLWSYLRAYLNHLYSLPGYVSQDFRKKSVFLSCKATGQDLQTLSNSSLNKGLNSLWRMVHPKQSFNSTLLRKSVVTHVRSREPRSRDMLARHMSHQASTADRYYQLHEAREAALPVSRLICDTMAGPSSTALPSPEPPAGRAIEVDPCPIVTEPSEDEDRPEDVPTPPEKKRRMSQVGIHGRRSFEVADAEQLIRLCEPLQAQSISLTIVMTHLMGTPEGLALLARLQCALGENWRKKVVDRVRAEFRKRRRHMQ